MLWIARLSMSRSGRIIERKQVDSTTEQTTYKWDKEIRKKIDSVNSVAQMKAFSNTYSFHGLHIVNDDQRKLITQIAYETDAKLKEIDSGMSATAMFFPLEENKIKKDKIYEAVILTLKEQVYGDILKKLEKVAGKELNNRTKTALLRFTEKMKSINVFGDAEVSQKLEEIIEKIKKEDLAEIDSALRQQLVNVDERMEAFMKEYE